MNSPASRPSKFGRAALAWSTLKIRRHAERLGKVRISCGTSLDYRQRNDGNASSTAMPPEFELSEVSKIRRDISSAPRS